MKYQWWPVPRMPAGQVEDGVQVDQPRGGLGRDEAQLVEDHCHQHRREEFEEAFHPEVDDPEPPVVDDGEVGVGSVEQRRHVEEGDGHGGVEEERGQLALLRPLHGRTQGPEHEEEPEDQARRQQQLPEAAQVEVLAALVAEPEPEAAQQVVDACPFSEEAAEDHEGQGPQEHQHPEPLALGFRTAHQGRQEEPPGHPGGGDPEDGQLQVPGARQVVGQDGGQIEAIEGARFHTVVGQRAAQGRLDQEEDGDHGEVEAERLLARREHPFLEAARRGLFPARSAAPAQVVELPEDEEDQSQTAQQGHQAEGAPEVGGSGGAVAHQGLEGPVVRVGIVGTRTLRHGRPGGPGEVGIQALQLSLVVDVIGGQARRGFRSREVVLPFPRLGSIGGGLSLREGEDISTLVVAVLLQDALQGFSDLQGLAFG